MAVFGGENVPFLTKKENVLDPRCTDRLEFQNLTKARPGCFRVKNSFNLFLLSLYMHAKVEAKRSIFLSKVGEILVKISSTTICPNIRVGSPSNCATTSCRNIFRRPPPSVFPLDTRPLKYFSNIVAIFCPFVTSKKTV